MIILTFVLNHVKYVDTCRIQLYSLFQIRKTDKRDTPIVVTLFVAHLLLQLKKYTVDGWIAVSDFVNMVDSTPMLLFDATDFAHLLARLQVNSHQVSWFFWL